MLVEVSLCVSVCIIEIEWTKGTPGCGCGTYLGRISSGDDTRGAALFGRGCTSGLPPLRYLRSNDNTFFGSSSYDEMINPSIS